MNNELYKQVIEIIGNVDKEVADIIISEDDRISHKLNLIPSENYVSLPVLLALSSTLTNKYSEGYPHNWKSGIKEEINKRYYQGQQNTNAIELLAIKRALELFTPDPEAYHANVQPLSGAPANLAVLNAFLNPGDTFFGLSLDYGGHLTHGHKASVTSKYYHAIQYPLGKDDRIDFDLIERMAIKNKPKLIMCGATAYPFKIDFESFGKIAKKVNAILVADIAHICGLCIAGVHPHPFPHADVITTTTHKILRGPRAGLIISKKEYGEVIDRAVFPGLQGGPHMNTIAAMAIAFKQALSDDYKKYINQVIKNAHALAAELQKNGFNLVGGGTETHLMLIDVINSVEGLKSINGSWLADRLETAGIIANKNAIPGDLKPWIPSGIRIGTPAVTTLGMKENDMKNIAYFITTATKNANDNEKLKNIGIEVGQFMSQYANSRLWKTK